MASAATLAAAIELKALRVTIGGRVLIDDLTLAVGAGELWCLLGANGAGKTMLLHTLVGLHRAAAGSVRLCGKPLAEWKIDDAARLRAFLPQFIPPTINTTVLDLVLMGRHPHLSRWRWEDDADRDIALLALQSVHLDTLAGHDAAALSGGERQRAAIAALFAQAAPVMLLDEPVAHLDLHHQIVVLQRLQALAADGHALMFSIHDLNLARRFATHALVVMGDGSATHGPVERVMNEATLSAAFDYPVLSFTAGSRTVFVAE